MLHYWWLAIRPKTLLASLGPILVGTSLAASSTSIDPWIVTLATVCAMSLQVGVNLANDLFDGLSGVDSEQRLGPPRMVQSGYISPSSMAWALALCTVVSMVTGLMLAYLTTWMLLVVGVFCLLGVFAYSAGPLPLASYGLGEATVLVFFGWVAVAGSAFLQTGHIGLIPVLLGTSVGLFSAAMMLVNNLRDRETDQRAGKYTLAVILDDALSRRLYVGLVTIPLAIHVCATSMAFSSIWTILLPVVTCVWPIYQLVHSVQTLQQSALNDLLSNTARVGFLYCIVVSISQLVFLPVAS